MRKLFIFLGAMLAFMSAAEATNEYSKYFRAHRIYPPKHMAQQISLSHYTVPLRGIPKLTAKVLGKNLAVEYDGSKLKYTTHAKGALAKKAHHFKTHYDTVRGATKFKKFKLLVSLEDKISNDALASGWPVYGHTGGIRIRNAFELYDATWPKNEQLFYTFMVARKIWITQR